MKHNWTATDGDKVFSDSIQKKEHAAPANVHHQRARYEKPSHFSTERWTKWKQLIITHSFELPFSWMRWHLRYGAFARLWRLSRLKRTKTHEFHVKPALSGVETCGRCISRSSELLISYSNDLQNSNDARRSEVKWALEKEVQCESGMETERKKRSSQKMKRN